MENSQYPLPQSDGMLVKSVTLFKRNGMAPVLLSTIYTILLRTAGEKNTKVVGGFRLTLQFMKGVAFWIGSEKYRLLKDQSPKLE